MDASPGGVKGLFWNAEEKRLRALFRVPAVTGLVLLLASLILPLVALLNSLLGLPDIFPQIGAFALVTVAVVAVAWFVDRRHLADMGLGLDRQWGRDLAAGLAVGAGMAAVAVAMLVVTGQGSVSTSYAVEDPDFVFGGGPAAVGVVYGLLFFTVFATLEEVLVRGYLLVNAAEGMRGYLDSDRRAVLVAIGLTALLFGVLHAANPSGTVFSLLNIGVAGLFFGLSYAATSRLAFPIGAHVTWNFAVGSVFGMPVSGLRTDSALLAVESDGSTFVTGGSFGPEGGVVMLVGLAAGIGAFVLWARHYHDGLSIDDGIAVPDLWISGDENPEGSDS